MGEEKSLLVTEAGLRAMHSEIDDAHARIRKALGNLASTATEAPPRSDEPVGTGELCALAERIARISKQLKGLHPLAADQKRHPKANGAQLESPTDTSTALLAVIRSCLDGIEDRIAESLPRRSSGRISHIFHGHKRVSREDGEAIRADFHSLGREATYLKWCFEGKCGYPAGTGSYTARQVQATLSHDAGGHRRRRRHAATA